MSSLKQIEANRRNALKSTGPTTPEGKQRSRCNAVRHGLTAETIIAALEDSEDYQAFEAAVISDYDAELAVERELVLRLASVLWRLRRATGIETALFELATEDSPQARTPAFMREPRWGRRSHGAQSTIAASGTGIRRYGGKRAQLQCEEGYRGLLLAPGRSADLRSRSPQSLRIHAVAASATDCIYARVVAAPQATAEPFNLSLFVPATRARRLVRRVQVITREVNAERAESLLCRVRRATLIEINLIQLQGRLAIWGNPTPDTIISVLYIFSAEWRL